MTEPNLTPRHVNWWWHRRVTWLEGGDEEGRGRVRRYGIVVEPRTLGKPTKAIQLKIAVLAGPGARLTRDGMITYRLADDVEEDLPEPTREAAS